jgi:hypothetical protein
VGCNASKIRRRLLKKIRGLFNINRLQNSCIIALLFTPSLIKIEELNIRAGTYDAHLLHTICIYDLAIERKRISDLLSPKKGQCK